MITGYWSRPHYAAHVAPILDALPWVATPAVLVASHRDLADSRRLYRTGSRIRAHHGIGQSYTIPYPSYPGGKDNDDVDLFLVPNGHAAGRWHRAYPHAAVEVVGSPVLDTLPARRPGPGPVVAYSTHWDARFVPEAGSAWRWIAPALAQLAQTYEVIGHAHPLARDLTAWYHRQGIRPVASFGEVCEQADVYICDNSSTLYEFASTGRPVVVLDAPRYRRDVDHGLRFWEAADVGVRVHDLHALPDAVALALEDPEPVRAAREAALDIVYAYRTGAAQRAADAIVEWLA